MPTSTETSQDDDKIARIRTLNDNFRHFLTGGHVVFTSGVQAMPQAQQIAILKAVTNYDTFSNDSDPFAEHDFGALEIENGGEQVQVFWKIDYFDLSLTYHSPDASDPKLTRRVLTIMLASEY